MQDESESENNVGKEGRIKVRQIQEESESQNNGGKKQEVESQKSEEKVKVIWERKDSRILGLKILQSTCIHFFCANADSVFDPPKIFFGVSLSATAPSFFYSVP